MGEEEGKLPISNKTASIEHSFFCPLHDTTGERLKNKNVKITCMHVANSNSGEQSRLCGSLRSRGGKRGGKALQLCHNLRACVALSGPGVLAKEVEEEEIPFRSQFASAFVIFPLRTV